MELKNLIASSETVDIYREGDKAVKIFKTGRKTDALYEALTHARIEYTDLLVPTIHEVSGERRQVSGGYGGSPAEGASGENAQAEQAEG